LNGKLISWAEATVPILSHGFSRASAIFEVFGVHVGPDGPAAFRIDEHLTRLNRSASLLGMEMAYSDQEIIQAVTETVKANNAGRALVKVIAYWGEEAVIKLVLDSKLDLAVFVIPDGDGIALDESVTISACISKWNKIHPKTVPVGAKACSNYLNGYLARKDAAERGFDIGILMGTDGFLAEGSIESVFMVKDAVIKTPPLGRILSGITRLSILEAAHVEGIPVVEEPITRDALFEADELFTSHTGIKVTPINRLEDRALEVPGPVTKQLIELMDNITHFRDARFKKWFQTLA
jgi:branched-chain amino acid aminotransferase